LQKGRIDIQNYTVAVRYVDWIPGGLKEGIELLLTGNNILISMSQ